MTKLLEHAYAIADAPPATDPAQHASDVATMRAALAEIRRRDQRDKPPRPVPNRAGVPDVVLDRGPDAVEAFERDMATVRRMGLA